MIAEMLEVSEVLDVPEVPGDADKVEVAEVVANKAEVLQVAKVEMKSEESDKLENDQLIIQVSQAQDSDIENAEEKIDKMVTEDGNQMADQGKEGEEE